MTSSCPSCFCHQPDSILCHDCTAAVATMLAAAPQLIDQLDVAVSKQARLTTGAKAGKGSAHERSPLNFGAMAARDALLVELVTWVRDVSRETWEPVGDRLVVVRAQTVPYAGPFHDQCGHASCERMRVCWVDPAPPVAAQAAMWLVDEINLVRRAPQAAEIVSGIGRAIKDAYRAIDRMQDRQYLGQCLIEEDGAVCHAEVWVRPGAHQVTCTQCETVHDVPARRAALLQRAEDMLVTVKEASRYMGEVGHIVVTEASIRGYLHRGRIGYRSGTMIRLGDLLAVVVDEGERRSA